MKMLRSFQYNEGMTRMELLPTEAPVYGGGLIVAFLPENYAIPEGIRVFLVFQGLQQRHVTEARISIEDHAFHAIIPDHEPPEEVEVSVYIRFSNREINCIATEGFKYFLDQTCYLARYLADSVHNLESLEDWDNIQGPQFSLQQEDFATLDERLASAFEHLILPPDWNILGNIRTGREASYQKHASSIQNFKPISAQIPRETLFHFAARLGLSTFVTLLLEKDGAQECLILKNRYGELAEDIARQRQFDGLADLITDPHAHGVIRWESEKRIGNSTVLKQHTLGTVSTSSEPIHNIWPSLGVEIEALCSASPPPDPVQYKLDDSGQTWESSMTDNVLTPGASQSLYYDEDEEGQQYMLPGTVYSPDYSAQYDRVPRPIEHVDKSRIAGNGKDGAQFLTDNLKHLREISDGIHSIRHRDLERLREGASAESARLSTSCPDLAKDSPGYFADTTFNDSYDSPSTPAMPRNRRALPLVADPVQLEAELQATYPAAPDTSEVKSDFLAHPIITDQKRHSWHSSESLQDESCPPTKSKSLSEQVPETASSEGKLLVESPPVVRRSERNNRAMFSLVVAEDAAESTDPSSRPKSMSATNLGRRDVVDAPTEADRRFTISEGFLPGASSEQDDAAHASDQNGVVKQISLIEFLADPRNFAGKPSKPPPLPPKPDFGHPARKLVTRKLSFLNRVRNSGRTKPKEKGKAKMELGFGNDIILPEEEPYDTTDASKEAPFAKIKPKRPSIIQRPQSMMVNRPAQYPVPNLSHHYTGPSRNGSDRPITTAGSLLSVNPTISEPSKSNRSSYHDDDDDGKLSTHSMYTASSRDMHGSYESLDDAAPDISELEKDPDLALKTDEPEAWSVTMEKKVLKKMSKKEIKRQDNIFELVQTERNHLTNLKIMQKIFAQGLRREMNYDLVVDKLFPLIDEHVEFATSFVQKLVERQSDQKTVERIGDILVSQWKNESGETMKRLLGDFCSKHNEITTVYKELVKSDKKFQAFIAKCEKNPLTRRREIPQCALLVTQRITKYPVMVQAILDNSSKKDHKDDYDNLTRALELSKEIAKDVDEQVQAQQRQQLLLEIQEKTDAKSSTTYKDGRRFDRKDLRRKNRKLLYSSNTAQLKLTKKFAETQLLLLSDCIVFLQENGGKYSFFSGLPAVLPLHNLIVREVANDERGLYLLSPRSQQMYEMKTQSAEDCKTLTQKVRLAVGNCPDEDEGISEDEEDRRQLEIDRARLDLIMQLEEKDKKINDLLSQKMLVFKQLAESVEKSSSVPANSFTYPMYSSEEDVSVDPSKRGIPSGVPFLTKALEQVSKLSSAIYGAGGLSRHPSSVGEHETSARNTPSLPKRSDTFGGFDNDKEPASPRSKYLNSSQSESQLGDLNPSQSIATEATKRDSGLVDFDVTITAIDAPESLKDQWNRPDDSSQGSSPTADVDLPLLPPTSDQVKALTQLSHQFNSFLSVATQQHTYLAKLQLQLTSYSQDRGVTKKRAGTLQEAELKRNQIKQQEQMDVLRREQQQLKSERDHFKRQNERIQRSLEKERVELDDEKQTFAQQKSSLKVEWDALHKARDDYQRDLARLRELQRKTQHDLHPSSSSSSVSSLGNKNSNNNIPDSVDLKVPDGKGSRSYSSLQAASGDSKPQISPTYASSSEYPRTFPGSKKESSSVANPVSSHQQLPIHLQFSATNQIAAMQDPKQQQLPLKIAQAHKKTGSGDKQHTLITGKLSKLASGQSGPSTTSEHSKGKLSLRSHKRSSNTDLYSTHLQVPAASSKPTGHENSSPGFLSPSSVSPSRLSDSSVERSNSSSSSRDGDKAGMRFYTDSKSKHDREETVELFF